MKFPEKSEYNPVYDKYLALVDASNFFEQFDRITNETVALFESTDARKLNYRYAPDKWTIKEVLMHVIDTERGFSYRAIVCIRQDDKTPLFGMDEDWYANNVDVTNRSIDSLLEEFKVVRKGFRILFEFCTEAQSSFKGNGVGHKITARALGFISIGHTKHHLNIIRERYLNS
jgi:DinB superfamily